MATTSRSSTSVYLPEATGRRLLDEDLSTTSVIGTVERLLDVSAVYVEQAIEVRAGEPIEHAVTFPWTSRDPYTMMLFRADRLLR